MSKYTMYYNSRQAQYREFATNWIKSVAAMELTERQKRGMALFFRPIGKRFGLLKEFKDIGVI